MKNLSNFEKIGYTLLVLASIVLVADIFSDHEIFDSLKRYSQLVLMLAFGIILIGFSRRSREKRENDSDEEE